MPEDFVERARHPRFVAGGARGQMPFAGGISDHQDAHREKTRETLPDFFHGPAERRNSLDEILLHEENRLDAADFSGAIFEREIMMFEVRSERVRDDFVETVVLGFALERMSPGFGLVQVTARKNACDAVAERNWIDYGHRVSLSSVAGRRGDRRESPRSIYASHSEAATALKCRFGYARRAAEMESRSRLRAAFLQSRN